MPIEIITINLGGVNCYLLESAGTYLLVDTGFSNKRVPLDRDLEGAGVVT